MTPQRVTRLVPWALVVLVGALLAAVATTQRSAERARARVDAIVTFESDLGRESNLTLSAVSFAGLPGERAARYLAAAERARVSTAPLASQPRLLSALAGRLAAVRASEAQVLRLLARDGATAAFFDEAQDVLPRENTVFAILARAQTDGSSAARQAEAHAEGVLIGGLALTLLTGVGLVVVYVAARRRLDRDALAQANARAFGELVRHSGDAFAILDAAGAFRTLSGAVEELFGLSPDALVGTPFPELVHPEDVETLEGSLVRSARVSCRMRHRDGYWLQVEVEATDLREDPVVAGVALTLRDTSERHAMEAQLRHRAFHDPLTELPNRALFFDRLEQAVHRAERDGERAAVLFIDLDDFKRINDELGHAGGDELLIELATRLRWSVRSVDTVGRLGGDEFGVLLERVGTTDEARTLSERILAALRPGVALRAGNLAVTVSAGLAMIDERAGSAEAILQRADGAMYRAKEAGKDGLALVGEHAAPPAPAGARLAWADRGSTQRADVARLLADPGLITTVFQPIVDLRSGLTAGYEALTRFGGPVSHPPDVWIAQAHRCGLGVELEIACLNRARESWDSPEGISLSVNLSPSALVAAEAAGALAGDLSATVIEITENELISGNVAWHDAVRRLRTRGARFAVDDAGAGVAGFAQIARLRPEVIKLDRSLVSHIGQDGAGGALVDALVHFGRRIGAVTCAEGIEDAGQLAALARLDVALGQGYAFARPAAPRPEVDPEAAQTCRQTLLDALEGRGQLEELGTRLNRLPDARGLPALTAALARHLRADKLCVFALTAGGDELVPIAEHGTGGASGACAVADYPSTAEMIRDGHAVQVLASDPHADPAELDALREYDGASMLMLPLAASGQVHGTLELVRDLDGAWSHTQIALARDAARALGRLLERSRDLAPVL